MHTTATERFSLVEAIPLRDELAADVRRGLSLPQKTIPPQYFYDALGSALFEAICELPEYYVTRCESEILSSNATAIARKFGNGSRLVELGSGSARKTRYLIEALVSDGSELEYVPIDIDAGMLAKSSQVLLEDYPELSITAISSDFRKPSLAIPRSTAGQRTVVLFLGSSIGNLSPEEAAEMLVDLRSVLSSGDSLLLGADLKKPKAILDAAYDDALGVTAAFNRNLLLRVNRELGANFVLDRFEHRAFYDEAKGRIEMHLVSREAQQVDIRSLAMNVTFAAAETIHTENSYKHDDATLEALAAAGDFTIEERWLDSRGWFTDVLLTVR
jgi:L-histidine N-alpha-methyltransferase